MIDVRLVTPPCGLYVIMFPGSTKKTLFKLLKLLSLEYWDSGLKSRSIQLHVRSDPGIEPLLTGAMRLSQVADKATATRIGRRCPHPRPPASACTRRENCVYIGPLIIRTGFWGPHYYKFDKEPNRIGTYLSPYSRAEGS